jgi:hypothetical protein
MAQYVYSASPLVPNSLAPSGFSGLEVLEGGILVGGALVLYCHFDSTMGTGGVCATLRELGKIVTNPDGSIVGDNTLEIILQAVQYATKAELAKDYKKALENIDPGDDCQRLSVEAVMLRHDLERRYLTRRKTQASRTFTIRLMIRRFRV